ncbi:TonB-dependent receptor [Idiomarina tyrosinivorans]|uniref:TonB-dependent receptor n=1 Tax=Idiomarina tyrosinivorans TaxID=1445662 RepID=A0A432ZR20_9GAMM|nr:TonB-dependent receptor [Idiomarina tyrosinivorans]
MFATSPLVYAQQAEQQSQDVDEVIEVVGDPSQQPVAAPDEQNVKGLFGNSQSIVDIPRAVTALDEAILRQAKINDLHDLKRVTGNAYGASGFGTPSLPTFRGMLGEIFEAGMRRQAGNNGLGFPLSFNAFGQIDVVKGAPPVMLGTTQRVGGFVNLHPKEPSLDNSFGHLTLNVGEWQKRRVQWDYSTPIDSKQALRVSLEALDQDSFYDYAGQQSQDLLLAYKRQPDANSEWNLALEYYNVEWTDNAGINRPTQALIDDGLYITGQGVQPNGSTVPGPGAVISPTGQVKIDRSTVLTDPKDINEGETLLLHSTYETQWNSHVDFINRTYYQYLTREGINQNSFVEIIDGAHTLENRSEWHIDTGSVIGVNVRYNDVLGYSQFTTEADLPSDLTGTLQQRRIPLTAEQKARLVQLRSGLYVSPGGQYDVNNDGVGDYSLSDTTDSISWQAGLFGQHKWDISERFWITLGGRLDYYWVKAQDPLPPQGVKAAEDTYSDWLSAYSGAVFYRPIPALTFYTSAYKNDSTSNSMAGGNVLNADNMIDPQNFKTENSLYEVGMKYAPDGSHWYVDAVLFDQTRSLRNRDGSNSGIASQGAELQLSYNNESLWWRSAASYNDVHYDNSAASQDVRQVADAFDNSRPDIIAGTGVGAPSFTSFPASNNRVQGIPRWQLSSALGYQLGEHWSIGGNAIYTDSYPLDFLQTVMIRDQINLNAFVAYRFMGNNAEVRLDVFNVTDEENWSPVFEGGYFGSTLVFPELPRRAELSVTYRF